MLFREVQPELERVLRQETWLGADHEVTVLRDIDGRVRLMVGSPTAGQDPDPEASHRQLLENKLRAALGPWLGDHTPIWQQPAAPHAVAELILRDRRPWSAPGVPWAAFQLDRHVARHGWVGDLPWSPPWPLADADAGVAPPVWVFFSQKGGVGRTTAVGATASFLARRGLRVLVVDLDLEAPGLGHLLVQTGPGDAGVIDLLTGPEDDLDVRAREALKEVSEPHLVGAGGLSVVPAGYVDEDYLRMLARLDLQGAGDAEAAVARLRRVLVVLRDVARPDLVILDARAGFHDVGGIAVAALAHGVVFFGRANEQSWHGLRSVARVTAGLSRDADDDAEVWLQVVHSHAPESEPTPEHREFQDRSWSIFCEEGYYRENSPDVSDRSRPHFPVAVPWDSRLRSAGGAITPDQLVTLDRLHGELAARLAGRFDATRERAGLS
jgi:cellulose biosynthesis protein BcsQ